MKRLVTLFILGATLVASGCGSDDNTNSTTTSANVIPGYGDQGGKTETTNHDDQYRCKTIRGKKICIVYLPDPTSWIYEWRFAACAPQGVQATAPQGYDGYTDAVVLFCE